MGDGPDLENFEASEAAVAAACLEVNLPGKLFPLFVPLLQRGIEIRVPLGCSLAALLGEEFGLTSEYVRDRIKTVFLDGKPVDDLERTPVRDHSVLALSAAMPGLAGATLRRGGRLAGLRSSITYRGNQDPIPASEGFITLKLFNLLLSELGPRLLHRGIYLSREELQSFFPGLQAESRGISPQPRFQGRKIDDAEFRAGKWLNTHPRFFLTVEFSP